MTNGEKLEAIIGTLGLDILSIILGLFISLFIFYGLKHDYDLHK